MDELIKAIKSLAAMLTSGFRLFLKGGQETAQFLIHHFISGAHSIAPKMGEELAPALSPLLETFITLVKEFGPGLTSQLKPIFSALAAQNFTEVSDLLKGEGESTPDRALLAASIALGNAFGLGASSAGVTALFESVFPEKLNTLNAAGPLFAEMAGFKEIAGAVRDPLYHNAFGKSLEYHYRSIFRPELPDEQDAVLWHARRLLTDDQLRKVFHFSGLKTEYEEPYVRSAYRAVQPRAIASAIQDTPFPYAEMKDLLEFAGLRKDDVLFLLKVFDYNSTKNVRQQFLSALTTAAERGTLSTADLDAQLKDLDFSDQAKNYVHRTVAVRRLEQLAELYRKSVTVLYETGQLTDAQYVPALEAIGINQADAEAHFAVDSARLRGKALAASEREAAREAARIQRLAIVTLRTQFLAGQIDVVTLTAELAAATFDPLLVAGIVANLEAQLSARRRDVAGKLVSATDAKLLTEQIAAINEQTVKKLLTPAQALQQIEALGIPAANAEALVAKWAAQADKVVLPI